MSDASIPPPVVPAEASDRRIRRSWRLFAGSFLLLAAIVLVRLGAEGASALDWAVVILLVVAGGAGLINRQAVTALETGRRAEAESFARILSGLSRSISPDAILGAIVDELGISTDADHIVVVRRRPDARVLDATLISARAGVPNSHTLLPIADLEDPVFETRATEREPAVVAVMAEAIQPVAVAAGPVDHAPSATEVARARVDALIGRAGRARPDPSLRGLPIPADSPAAIPGREGSPVAARDAQLVADRIAARTRRVYGLRETLAAPLTTDQGVVGAIVLSHRTDGSWSPTAHRLLAGAAEEASAALARAYSHRAAEARATTDALTGLPNRRYFDEFCGLLARRRRSDDAVGVLMIDIDHFKQLNDAHGHATGDEVLRAVGGAIISAVREDDVPARYGGEEFVVLLRNPGRNVAFEVGERVRSAVGELDLARLGVERVSVSVGVAVSAHPDQPIDALIERADQALYKAKRAGRDRVVAA